MGHERRPMDIYTCDAPGCFRREYCDMKIDPPPEGWHGTITVVYGGGSCFEFYACSHKHAGSALKAAYERAQLPQHEQ